jgi:hypothetical protein
MYILELFYDKDLVQTVVDDTNCCAGQLKISRGNIFIQAAQRKCLAAHDNGRNVYFPPIFHAYGNHREASLSLYFS